MRRAVRGAVRAAAPEPATAERARTSLSVADQQMLEIARALVSDATAILFDEPTASLAQAERDALFGTMDRLRAKAWR